MAPKAVVGSKTKRKCGPRASGSKLSKGTVVKRRPYRRRASKKKRQQPVVKKERAAVESNAGDPIIIDDVEDDDSTVDYTVAEYYSTNTTELKVIQCFYYQCG